MWDTRSLEKLVNRTTLSTQRVLHTHILELGEQLRLSSSLNAKTDNHLKSPPKSVCSPQPVIGWDEADTPAVEEFKLLAEKEKHTALRLQEERLRAKFEDALRARDRLEAEVRLELQQELQAGFKAHCEDLRSQMEEEKVQAVEEACRKLREQLEKRADEDHERTIQALQDENQEHVRRCVEKAERSVREDCDVKAQGERQVLEDKHAEDISELHNRMKQLQDSLEQVCGERIQYEAEFKKVQASYKQFVDLTDSSMHSDYLLKLRRLGREPGLTDTASQTDDITPEL
ncbi:uncharacterized protein [Paramisgurnus dabryanus]|uniref:uncharacterized protein n=1 Tax=Paramisgurnus dabryanus TaxID=90735 RepID=UPI0031F43B16